MQLGVGEFVYLFKLNNMKVGELKGQYNDMV